MHVILLRLALALYSVGFAQFRPHRTNKKQTWFVRLWAAVFGGFILHVASIGLRAWDDALSSAHQQYEAFSFFGPLATLGFSLLTPNTASRRSVFFLFP